MLLHPVEQRELVLCHARQQVRIRVAFLAELLRHVFRDFFDARVILVRTVRDEQVELGVFFDFDAEVVERRNRRVAGEKVLRTRAERDDFEALEAE